MVRSHPDSPIISIDCRRTQEKRWLSSHARRPTGSIEVTERGHGEVAILVDELGEVTAIDLPAERAAALAQAILAHVGKAPR